ncbi:rhodanese-like domain-containing protein [Luteolibacter sp. SL250]|uniref:rhodanese-like domain-containing protein n=1 Tax=Luteolibacter sp. SL250 TaxID=2995170 RepID=UPI00226FB2C3|nr:rhodanese-like domain-containing protein [Luteolibacter sp. SL250]WAC21864.1 rhodanese-like domain-containing protein [Luteolibacter sp. SL250]
MASLSSILFPLAVASAIVSCAPHPAPAQAPAQQPEETKAPEKSKRLPASQRGTVSSISLTKLFELQQSGNVLIYDARPSVFYKEGHIPGAISVPKSVGREAVRVRDPELKAAKAAGKPIVVYCTGVLCADARTVARYLASAGYSSSTFSGGWDEWKSAGLPTE